MAQKQEDSSHTVTMSRPLSQSEENWAKLTDQGTGIAACGIALKRYVEEIQITKALHELMDHYAIARARIVENNKGKLYLQVHNSPAKPTVKEKSWPNVDHSIFNPGVLELQNDDENHTLSLALNQIVCSEINIPFLNINKIAAPPLDVLEVHFYRNSSMPQTIIVIRIHSGACDRTSCCVMVKHFLTALNAIVEGRKPEFPDSPGKNELTSPMEDMIPKGKADKGFLTKGLDVLGYALDSKKYSLLPFNPEFTKMPNNGCFMSDIVTYNLGREGTNALYSACKKENTTLTAALASAYLQTASNIKELKEKKLNQFCFTGVLDCRPYFEPPLAENALGNYSAGILQGAQVKNDISFWDLARLISSKTEKEVRKHKHFSELPVLAMLVRQVMKHPSLTPNSSKRSGLFTLFFGEPGKIEWKDMDSLNVAGSLGPVASMHAVGPCFCACESMREGPDLCISFIFATPVFTKDQMHCFATSVFELLKSSSCF
ncbi:uncharacterized protein LOC131038564 [Cryptomeria japonica]|uniref:uncharacterized protein LOC131038564 n=1 Tax=Cryptomeria japonica TaxID=3369 RepID=UPI0027D9D3BE|nr:uncharacterized protein LOC131038564 [Cryptomeria japonica]XP_057827029.2 uncharacterized protein LOC131038564 [Cryptomeria japonica]